jgi:predicted AlkP superfamily phosphohydrolase/phosphomutase
MIEAGLGMWAPWLRVSFDSGFMKKSHAIVKACYLSHDPFKLYLTAMQIDPGDPIVPITYPNNFSAELAQEIGLYYTLGMPEETDGYMDGRLGKEEFLKHIYEIEDERDRMFWRQFKVFQNAQNSILGFVYDSSDRLQHVMWKSHLLKGEKLEVPDEVRDYLKRKDDFIGEVVGKIDERTLFMLISDHGFTSFERAFSMNRWLVDQGYMSLTKEPEGSDDGALFKYVDWSKTKAYSLGFNSIYVNKRSREAKGIVSDVPSLVDSLINDLKSYRDDENGQNPVHEAYRANEIYDGPYIDDAPELQVGFKPGYRMAWQTAIGGFSKDAIFDNERRWKGDHLVDPSFVSGILFSNHKLKDEKPSQMDIAPTALAALGIEVLPSFDGRSLLL